MFQNWDFLLAEIWGLLVLAALIGLFAGWLIWGGRREEVSPFGLGQGTGPDADEVRRLRAELDRVRASARPAVSDPIDDVPPMQGGGYRRPTPPARPVGALPTPEAPAPLSDSSAMLTPDETSISQSRPPGLSAPRDGLPDDLTKIRGVGEKLERLCNDLGFWHYEQIAAWTPRQVEWVDDNLEGFKGRVTRDDWVGQARALAHNDLPTFRRRP